MCKKPYKADTDKILNSKQWKLWQSYENISVRSCQRDSILALINTVSDKLILIDYFKSIYLFLVILSKVGQWQVKNLKSLDEQKVSPRNSFFSSTRKSQRSKARCTKHIIYKRTGSCFPWSWHIREIEAHIEYGNNVCHLCLNSLIIRFLF